MNVKLHTLNLSYKLIICNLSVNASCYLIQPLPSALVADEFLFFTEHLSSPVTLTRVTSQGCGMWDAVVQYEHFFALATVSVQLYLTLS